MNSGRLLRIKAQNKAIRLIGLKLDLSLIFTVGATQYNKEEANE